MGGPSTDTQALAANQPAATRMARSGTMSAIVPKMLRVCIVMR